MDSEKLQVQCNSSNGPLQEEDTNSAKNEVVEAEDHLSNTTVLEDKPDQFIEKQRVHLPTDCKGKLGKKTAPSEKQTDKMAAVE